MKTTVRYLSIAVTVAIALIFNGVAGSESGAGKKLGIMWMGESGMAERVFEGLMARLEAEASGMAVEVQKELPGVTEAAAIYRKWQTEKDGIVFLRSSGAEFLAANPPEIPAFIGGCNNPKSLGVVENMEAPEGKITGVTYYLSPSLHLNLYKQIIPKLTSIGLLLEKGHPGTPIDRDGTKAASKMFGLAYHEAVIGPEDDLKAKVKALAGKVDLLIIGNESLIINSADAIAEAAGETPVASYPEAPVTAKQVLAGIVPSDEKLGRMLGDSVIDVLLNGKAVREVPIKIDDQPSILICVEKIIRWNVKVPIGLLKVAELVK